MKRGHKIMTTRFAPLIRVSTEGQAKRGESLKTQKSQIMQYVKSLKGVIPESCWKYSGQEHATPEQERIKLDRLLEDSSKDIFDAVIVCDASRWSRDNLKSKEGLNVLRTNGIRFFVGTTEFNLFSPEHCFYLGMNAEIGEFQARQQSLKSIMNRIERAKQNRPTSGFLPYGRTYSEKNGWGLDAKKVAGIQWAAARYLEGMSIVEIAKNLGMNFSNLWKVLNQRSGDKWEIRFRSKPLNIDETVELTIPRLLDEGTVAAIKEKAKANKTYTHGHSKNKYLLSRMIFCGKCGYTLMGQTNKGDKRYYRHPRRGIKVCSMRKWLPANEIENSVLIHLVTTLGDTEKIRKAVERATPNPDKISRLMDEQTNIEKELKGIDARREKVVFAVADGLMEGQEIKKAMDKIRDREKALKRRLETVKAQLVGAPDPSRIKALSKLALNVLRDSSKRKPEMIFNRPYEWKRNLVEHAFAGTDSKGNRLGVYIHETGDEKQPWRFEIRGVLESAILALPLDDGYLENAFNLDPDYQDIHQELLKIRSNITSLSWSSPALSLPVSCFPGGLLQPRE